MAKKAPAIPLKDVMSAVDRKDKAFYSNLSDEKKKVFSAWMMMRYASSSDKNPAHYLYMVNELVNYHFSDVSKHPELQWLLLSACGTGVMDFHPYLKPPNARKKKNKINEFLTELFPGLKPEDIQMLADINTKAELKKLAEDYGYTDKEIKEIFGK